jgi:predicted transcriptional regulator
MYYLFLGLIFLCLLPLKAVYGLEVGTTPPTITLEGDLGSRVDGKPWSSDELKGRIVSLFYIDPDEKSLNEPLEAAYKKEEFPFDKHKSFAIINMDATWMPNGLIASKLKQKQEEFPQTTYVKDLKKSLVSKWGLKDDSINVVVFNKEGKILFFKKGPTTPEEISLLMKTIRAEL